MGSQPAAACVAGTYRRPGDTYRVAVVVRKNPKARRFAVTPHPRFRPPPAVGGGTAPAVGGGALLELDVNLHKHALGHGAGVRFSLESLRDKDEAGRWFVPAMTYKAIARNFEILASCHGGWKLTDELPGTDQLPAVWCRWQRNPRC